MRSPHGSSSAVSPRLVSLSYLDVRDMLAERGIQVDARPARGRLRGSATKSGGAAAG